MVPDSNGGIADWWWDGWHWRLVVGGSEDRSALELHDGFAVKWWDVVLGKRFMPIAVV